MRSTMALAVAASAGLTAATMTAIRASGPAAGEPAAGDALAALGLTTPAQAAAEHPTFDRYWYQGLAELARYRLEQARYGDLHDGEAVLVYVTEDFLADAQVKHEFGPGRGAVGVLKLNAYRRFYTGVYPYTLMTSTFTRVDRRPGRIDDTLKLTSTVQEWCGQAFTQLNRRDGGWQAELRSYFQAEGDRSSTLDGVWLEDELFSRVRIDPDSLPTGSIELLPAAHHLRMAHLPLEVAWATATLTDDADDGDARRYEVRYEELGRTLTLVFERAFPHRILWWEEAGPRGTTRAELTHSALMDYWNRNGAADEAAHRAALGLAY